jgi:hypothetical protein
VSSYEVLTVDLQYKANAWMWTSWFAVFVRAHVASSLASKLKSWVTIDDGKVVICQVCDEKIGCTIKS